ncbi:MAG: hypothetical protein A2Y10_02760 [Planctomycetes bacterium GWF2_41_51]|nr:MAG: hypothetical protein A2Y10_02760 [Planctomycetes bacterium GWF2_41_51]HBG27471.1 hypothetical protein [Phycisphaerales bacterium]
MLKNMMFFHFYIIAIASFCFALPQNPLPAIETPDFSNLISQPVLKTIENNKIVIIQDGNELTKNLIGIASPPKENLKQMANQFVNNLLKGENIFVVADLNDCNSVSVYRSPDAMFINAEIIRQGYGLASSEQTFKHAEQFKQFEIFARQTAKGIWGVQAIITAAVQDSNNIKLSDNDETTVYVTKSGTKYHTKDCRFLRKSSTPIKLSEAKTKYSPCSVCKPPQ